MPEEYEEEISESELEEFDYILMTLKLAGRTSVNGLDVLNGWDTLGTDYDRFKNKQRQRERDSTWRPKHVLKAALAPGTVTKELGDLTVKELLEIEVSLEQLIELRRTLGESRGGKGQAEP